MIHMETFYEDKDAFERQKGYVGKNMGEIMDLEQKVFDEKLPEIDNAHAEWLSKRNKNMLTVQKLMDFLKTQDPNGCILAFEPNSNAYIEQLPTLPSPDIMNVAMAKKELEKTLTHWYKGKKDIDKLVERDVSTVFRYAHDNDVIIRF